jgi:hypothetical protein
MNNRNVWDAIISLLVLVQYIALALLLLHIA